MLKAINRKAKSLYKNINSSFRAFIDFSYRIVTKSVLTLFVVNFITNTLTSWIPLIPRLNLQDLFSGVKNPLLNLTLSLSQKDNKETNLVNTLLYIVLLNVLMAVTLASYQSMNTFLFSISIISSVTYMICNVSLFMKSFNSYHEILSSYMNTKSTKPRVNITFDDMLISSVTMLLATFECFFQFICTGSLYFAPINLLKTQLSTPLIYSLTKIASTMCMSHRLCDHISLSDFGSFATSLSQIYLSPAKFVREAVSGSGISNENSKTKPKPMQNN